MNMLGARFDHIFIDIGMCGFAAANAIAILDIMISLEVVMIAIDKEPIRDAAVKRTNTIFFARNRK